MEGDAMDMGAAKDTLAERLRVIAKFHEFTGTGEFPMRSMPADSYVVLRAAAGALEAQAWISVEDELPTTSGNVLLASKGGRVTVGYAEMLEDDGGTRWPRWWELNGDKLKFVTHWIPLPAPPEGE